MNNSEKYITTKDYLVSGETFDLVYDQNLDFLKTIPQPELDALSKYYESQDYISHTDGKKDFFSKTYQFVKKMVAAEKDQIDFQSK